MAENAALKRLKLYLCELVHNTQNDSEKMKTQFFEENKTLYNLAQVRAKSNDLIRVPLTLDDDSLFNGLLDNTNIKINVSESKEDKEERQRNIFSLEIDKLKKIETEKRNKSNLNLFLENQLKLDDSLIKHEIKFAVCKKKFDFRSEANSVGKTQNQLDGHYFDYLKSSNVTDNSFLNL